VLGFLWVTWIFASTPAMASGVFGEDPEDESNDDEFEQTEEEELDRPFVSGRSAAELADEEGGMDCGGLPVGAAGLISLPLLVAGRRRRR
jgi:hypothetical protein